jgi:TDG/mug DNA glycosylase family protein
VPRASARADELSRAELAAGGRALADKVQRYAPRILAVLGISAYRTAFQRLDAQMGPQPETTGGIATWIIPNPSGLNAHYSLDALAKLLRELNTAASQEAE